MANQSPQPPGRPPTFEECQQILEQAKIMECREVKVYQDPQPTGHPPTAEQCQHILQQATRGAQTKSAGNPPPQKPSAYVENWTTIEADNGAIFRVDLNSIHLETSGRFKHAEVIYYIDDKSRPPKLTRFLSDCNGHFREVFNTIGPEMYAPPRSAAGMIEKMACGK